jgi:23S rRNA (pseudouridine1915-N3)-methyltransferase
MKISVLSFGKLKTPGLRETADHYLGRIGSFAEISETELKPLPVPDKSPSTRKTIQEKEAKLLEEAITKKTPTRGVFFLLDETGKALSTQGWRDLLLELETESLQPHFCIGASLGFDPELKKKARKLISLGPQTLPHELARVVLIEQIYRALTLKAGHPYHNES